MIRKLGIAAGTAALAFAVGFALLYAVSWVAFAPTRTFERTARSMVGQPEADVLHTMGKPQHVISAETIAGRTVDYPWKDMNYVPVPNHPVRNRVLLYSGMDIAVYIYLDEKGVVEHVAVAGT